MFRPAHLPPRAAVVRAKHQADLERRGSAASRGYGRAWRKARTAYLLKHPLCVCCLANGRVAAAQMVDHVIPHQGDMTVFWRSEDWQSLCTDCHQRVKQPLELRYKAGQATAAELRLNRRIPWAFPSG